MPDPPALDWVTYYFPEKDVTLVLLRRLNEDAPADCWVVKLEQGKHPDLHRTP